MHEISQDRFLSASRDNLVIFTRVVLAHSPMAGSVAVRGLMSSAEEEAVIKQRFLTGDSLTANKAGPSMNKVAKRCGGHSLSQ